MLYLKEFLPKEFRLTYPSHTPHMPSHTLTYPLTCPPHMPPHMPPTEFFQVQHSKSVYKIKRYGIQIDPFVISITTMSLRPSSSLGVAAVTVHVVIRVAGAILMDCILHPLSLMFWLLAAFEMHLRLRHPHCTPTWHHFGPRLHVL